MFIRVFKKFWIGGAALSAIAALTPSASASSSPLVDNASAPAMTAQDLVTMPRLGAPTVTPDGRFAAYGVTITNPSDYTRATTFYLLDLENEGAQPVAFDLRLDAHSLAFGPDRFLYFLASDHYDKQAENRTRLWRVALEANGNVAGPLLVAEFPHADIHGFAIAPTGDSIALWAPIARECTSFGCPDDGKQHLPGPGSGRLYQGDGGFFRHWDRWATPDTFNRVFIFDFTDGKVSGEGRPVDGFDPETGVSGNTPTMPFGGASDVAWAHDGSGLYFVAREANAEEPLSTDLDIYFSDLSGDPPVSITEANKAVDTAPAPSPNGRYLAYLAMERPGYESDKQVIQLRDLKTGRTQALTQTFDRSFGSLAWSADSSALLATAADVLDTPVFSIDPQNGSVSRLDLMAGPEAHIGHVTPLSANRVLFTRDSIGAPSELFLSQGYSQAKPLTDVATHKLGTMASTVTTRFSFEGAEGKTVWGQITRLERQTGPIPAILYIHGGPQGSFSDRWSSRWNPRVVASQGYAVISIDFHGSAGYGQAFLDSINQDWGGKPLTDLQLGLEAALKLDDQIDGSRACAMGASYGGYMVNWIAGKWPRRFRCLIQHDGLFDMRSFYYSTEELWFPRWDFGGSYADALEIYEKWNPVNHVGQWRTPMLVIAGENDFRVPYTQGLQSFTALQERGIPSQLLVFPDENHWVLGAANSLQWHNTVFAWLDRWLSNDAVPFESRPDE